MEVRNLGFQKLTPISDADLSVYEEAIDYVFDNNDIRNIALSGAYSSGKSSILESYKKKHANRRFVHISLTHFQSPEQDDGQVDEPVKESVLERKILNQLIHQIPAAKIPQTNFRVISIPRPSRGFFFFACKAFLLACAKAPSTDLPTAIPLLAPRKRVDRIFDA